MRRMTWLLAVLMISACVFAGCAPNEEAIAAEDQAQEWVTVQEEYSKLTAMREELAALKQRIADGAEADEAAGLGAEEVLAGWNEQAVEMESQTATAADEFSTLLVEFINKHAGYEGEEMGELQKAAIRLKSDEDVLLAREYVTKGGDYKRAISIIENALQVDPDHPQLAQELEELESLRYMTEERFGVVQKGMTEEDVRSLLGQVFHGNVREYPDREIVAWFYPKEGGAAAAVYFREQGGSLKVYDLNFNAVKTALERVE
jgi:tetratricopeptide (TPR) repeat protein